MRVQLPVAINGVLLATMMLSKAARNETTHSLVKGMNTNNQTHFDPQQCISTYEAMIR